MEITRDCRALLASVLANNTRNVCKLLTSKELHPTALALGLAVRYVGPKMTELLLDLDASLSDDVTEEYAGYLVKAAPDVEFIEYLYPQFSLETPIKGHEILADSKRIACAQVLLERQAVDPSQMLFYAILYADDPIRKFLESRGVAFDQVYMNLLEGNADTARDDVKQHIAALCAVFKKWTDAQVQEAILRFDPYLQDHKFPVMRYGLLSHQRVCEPQFISFALSNTDFPQESCNWSTVRHFLDVDSVTGLDYALAHNWASPEEQEYLLEMAHTDPRMSPEMKAAIVNSVKPEEESVLNDMLGLESDELSASEADASWTYTLQEDDTYKVTGYRGAARDVIIPASIDGKPVTAIDADTFNSYAPKSSEAIAWRRRSIVWVQFPGSIQTVPPELFADYGSSDKCPNLREVVLCEGVQIVDQGAFRGCKALSRVDLPASVQTIGAFAFADTGLTDLVLPGTVNRIGQHAFEGCAHMHTMRVKAAQPNADTPKLQELPDTVYGKGGALGEAAFRGCTDLHEAYLPETIQIIGPRAFSACVALGQIALPKDLSQIDDEAFRDCLGLRTCDLPPKLKKIGTSAFAGSGLEHVVIPGAVLEIGAGAFENCVHLDNVEFHEKIENIPNHLFRGCSDLQTVAFPAGTLTIGAHAFAGCAQLDSIRLSPYTRADVTAFEGCQKLANSNGCITGNGVIRGFSSLEAAKKAELKPVQVSRASDLRGFPENWYPLLVAIRAPERFEMISGPSELPTNVGQLSKGQTVVLGSFPISAACERAPLLWRVLVVGHGRALLLTERAILQRIDALDADPKWAPSPLRSFLNDAFFGFAFSGSERERILENKLTNDCKKLPTCILDEATMDRVFLLSEEEVLKYMPEESDRITFATDYALRWVTGPRVRERAFQVGAPWDLRSRQSSLVLTIGADGHVRPIRRGQNKEIRFIRPAVWVH